MSYGTDLTICRLPSPATKPVPTLVGPGYYPLSKKLEALPEELPEESILVTMDVKSLYTNVPNEEGIDAVKSYLRLRNRPGDGTLSRLYYLKANTDVEQYCLQ